MSKHTWRGDANDELGCRTYGRAHYPDGGDGYVMEDVDLVTRVHGPQFRTDAKGRLRMIEVKYGDVVMSISKARTFGLLNELLRRGDPDRARYDGWYVIRTLSEWEDATSFRVNGVTLTREEFDRWMLFDDAIQVTPLALTPGSRRHAGATNGEVPGVHDAPGHVCVECEPFASDA